MCSGTTSTVLSTFEFLTIYKMTDHYAVYLNYLQRFTFNKTNLRGPALKMSEVWKVSVPDGLVLCMGDCRGSTYPFSIVSRKLREEERGVPRYYFRAHAQ